MSMNIDKKQSTITGGASTITESDLTANRVLISSSKGKVAVSAVTSTELGHLDGVTSSVQNQIDTLKNKIGKVTIATNSASLSFSGGVATYSLNLSSYGNNVFGAYVCGKATTNAFACSITDGTATSAKFIVQCVDNRALSGNMQIAFTFLVV